MKILVAVDFSPVAERQLASVLRLAGEDDSIFVIHVAEPDPAFVGFEAGPDVVREQMAEHFHRQHGQVQEMARTLREAGCDATGLLVQGPTVDTILKQAASLEADLVVVGSHGHGAVFDMLVGSISSDLIRRSTIPVLVVPARTD